MLDVKKHILRSFSLGLLGLGFIACETENHIGTSIVSNGDSDVGIYYAKVNGLSANIDTIRTDDTSSLLFGVNKDPIFGTQKAGLVSNLRPYSLNPNFGTNTVLDSVYLSLNAIAKSNGKLSDVLLQQLSDEDEATLLGSDDPDENITFMKYKRTYEIANTFGDNISDFSVSVHEIDEKLVNLDDTSANYPNKQYFSNHEISIKNTLGEKVFTNTVDSIVIQRITKYSDGTTSTTVEKGWIEPKRIDLDKDYFRSIIIDQQGSINLSTNAHFEEYFKGIYLKTEAENGFMLKTEPNFINLVLKYSYDNLIEEDPDSTTEYEPRLSQEYILSSETGTKKFSIFNKDISNANPSYTEQLNIDSENYTFDQDFDNLYISGGNGNRLLLKISEEEIETIKDKIATEGWNILDAKIELYLDNSQSGIVAPVSLYLYEYFDKNGNINQNFDANKIVDDYYYSSPSIVGGHLVNYTNYSFNLTHYVKNITESVLENALKADYKVENDSIPKVLAVEIRDQAYNALQAEAKEHASSPSRAILIGNQDNPTNLGLRLKITYSK